MVRAKFQMNSLTTYSGTYKTVTFTAVSDTTTEENKRFTKYTPSGTLTMSIDNPLAVEQFELGKYYYVDFNPAEV